ncbi:MAG: histidine kinase [Oscillospiraceae bacterium]|jgi:signal transduction histidine kinase
MDFESYLGHIDQPVAILDKLYQVAWMNDAFARLFPQVSLHERLFVFIPVYPMLQPLLTSGEGMYPVQVDGRHYNAHVSFARYGKKRRPVGRCLVFTDISETVALLAQSRRQAQLLQSSIRQIEQQNTALAASIQMEREAGALRERALLLRDIHDTLGHTLTMINALYHLALNALPNEAAARSELREILHTANISIAALESLGDDTSGGIIAFLHRLRTSMARVGLDIVLEITGSELPLHHYMYADLIHICQEAATNAIKHGHATRLLVTLVLREYRVCLHICDNGHSEKPVKPGQGLRGMDERVNNLFGDFSCGKTPQGSFYVLVDAPVIAEE